MKARIQLQLVRDEEEKVHLPPRTSQEYRDGKTDDPHCHGGDMEVPEWEEEQAKNATDGPELKQPPTPTDGYREGRSDDPYDDGDPDAEGDYAKS